MHSSTSSSNNSEQPKTGFHAKLMWQMAFFVISVLGVSSFLIFFFIDGFDDEYYLRFSSPQQKSLILGTSRAAQGIVPEVFNFSKLNFERPIFNYGFTISSSPYGKPYYESISKKLDQNATNGLYILEINPRSITLKKAKRDDPINHRESSTHVGKMKNVNSKYNFEYFLKGLYQKSFYKIILTHDGEIELKNDGRLMIYLPEDFVTPKYIAIKAANTKRSLEGAKYSTSRLLYLDKIISLLKPHGRVILVRVPTGATVAASENLLFPDFDHKVRQIAERNDIEYYSFLDDSDDMKTTDGNHMHHKFAKIFTEKLVKILQDK